MTSYQKRKQYLEENPVDYSQGTYYGGEGLPQTSFEGQEASGTVDNIGTGLTTAGMIPTPASPFLIGAGLALKTGAGIYNAVKGSEAQDKTDARAEEDWNMKRAAYLRDMYEKKKLTDWNRRFTNALIGARGK